MSGLALSNEEYANLLSAAVGKNINYVDVPEEQAKENMLESGSFSKTKWHFNKGGFRLQVLSNGLEYQSIL